ncbi:Tetratricopeptide repeat protein [Nitrospira tepida]|uniref:Tetratricopeptide repeat protein n=1 Tax=Nitrospira tepida TaxID=2973512 RepID=A0AA86T731_9BACT|nr:tetratricopeptide repeat protein [Nitrospira tepida]CAI4031531.1 Tetratricopeptide repeat protein [Nitrospira tepida]
MRRHGMTHRLLCLLMLFMALASAGCPRSKPQPLIPLPLDSRAPQEAIALTEQGSGAYQSQQFDEAKQYFEQAVKMVPRLGAAHYNLALALNALGDAQAAHDEFIEAATLEPGHKVIWDSPALRPYGNPEVSRPAQAPPSVNNRRGPTSGLGGIGSGS